MKLAVSPPISLRRILRYDGQRVRYWYNDHKTKHRQEEEVSALTFIGRMVQLCGEPHSCTYVANPTMWRG